jgi:segregation and condensation protein A
MRILWGGKPVRYSTLFDDSESKSQMVATFLAVLELIKGKRVRVEGDGEEAQIQMLQRR